VALAEPDEATRTAKLVAIQERMGPGALGARDHVAKLLGQRAPSRGAGAAELREPPAEPTEPPVADDAAEPTDAPVVDDPALPGPTGRSSSTRPSPTPTDGAPTRDPVKAAALAKQAREAFAGNQLEQAEKLYHQALELDSRNEAALTGLSELYFERGRYRKSLEFAKKAVARAPEEGKLHILLGDAHYKVLEYADARRHYEKAQALGHPGAGKRLEKLEETVGK
jgi:tetratricopeptide (TPR) repeat protein